MSYKRALTPVAAVALVCGGVVAAYAATTSTQVTCPQHPAASGGQYSFVCTTTHPKSTETFHGVVPQPTPTLTPSSTPTSASPTPTVTPSSTPTATATPTSTPPPTGFPDASNTGASGTLLQVPSQVSSGPGWSWDSKNEDLTITGAGVTVANLQFNGTVDIKANNVTLQNIKMNAGGSASDGAYWGIGLEHVSGVTIENVTMTATLVEAGIKDVYGDSDATVLRNDLSGWTSGIQMSRGLVQDNYVHDVAPTADAHGFHLNGFTDNGGRPDGTMVVRHNTFLNSVGQTDAISFFEDFGTIKNVTVDDNLMAGGGYCLYAGANAGGTKTSNVVVTNNEFSTRYFPNCGGYGPVAASDNGTGNVWSGNVWADGPKAGQPVNP